MTKPHILFVVFAVIITLGLAIGLQGVLGLNIASPLTDSLDLGENKITNLANPTGPGDAATWDFVNSAVVAKVLYGYCGYKHPILASCYARPPAFCDPTVTFGNNCKCPAGYEMLPTGWSSDNAWVYISCYKL